MEMMQGLWPVLSHPAELHNAAQLLLEEIALHVEARVVELAAEIGRTNEEIINDGAVLPRSVAEQTPAALDELTRVGGTRQKKTHSQLGQIDALVQTADGDDTVQEAAA